jgi:hypothetical protein
VDEEEGKREVEGGFDEHYPLFKIHVLPTLIQASVAVE